MKRSKIKKHFVIALVALVFTFFICFFTFDISKKLITESYYFVFGKPFIIQTVMDDAGVPIVDYGGIIGKRRNPVTISQTALFYEEKYNKTNNETYKQLFLNCADWLVDNAVNRGNYTIWEYDFLWEEYNMTPPWRSGMAQGQGIQALIKAYNLTNNEKYLRVARTSLNAFYVEVKNGGVTYKESDGWWYEEYADENGSNSRVLDGMIFALLGIHEYYKLTGDIDAKYLFDKGIISLKKHLHKYDNPDGGCTKYDILGHLSSPTYHNIHVSQMSELYNITGDTMFKEYYDKWRNYKCGGVSYKLQVVIFLLNFFPIFILLEIVVFLTKKKYQKR